MLHLAENCRSLALLGMRKSGRIESEGKAGTVAAVGGTAEAVPYPFLASAYSKSRNTIGWTLHPTATLEPLRTLAQIVGRFADRPFYRFEARGLCFALPGDEEHSEFDCLFQNLYRDCSSRGANIQTGGHEG